MSNSPKPEPVKAIMDPTPAQVVANRMARLNANFPPPVPEEAMVQAILHVSDAIKSMRSTRLKDRALLLLIKDNCEGNLGIREIKAVLDAAESLARTYLK